MVNFDKEKLYASLLLSSEVVQYLVTVQKSEFKEEIGLGVSCACSVLRIATFVGFFEIPLPFLLLNRRTGGGDAGQNPDPNP